MTSPRVWLITGASSGFGLEMARYALAQGDKVVATLRKPNALASFASKYPSSQLLLIKLDVTNQQEIRDVFHKAKDAFGRVDVVFNNAGIVIAGEAEATPEESARKMFETNFWGAAHVSLEAIRFFRDENEPQGGRLIQTSAAAGFVGGGSDQGVGPCSQITTVEPGIFTTALETNAEFLPQHPAYTDDSSPTSIARKMLAELRSNGGVVKKSPAKFAQRIFELSELPNPPARLPLGHDCIAMLKGQVAKLTKATEEYASWSDDLGFEDVTSYAAG